MSKRRTGLARASSGAMLGFGAVILLLAVIYSSMVPAFIGLGLAFWGAILLYAKPEDYTRQAVLEVSVAPSIETLSQMIRELGYRGEAVYLPPRYFENPQNTKIYISKQEDTALPTPEQVQKYENQPFAKTPQGILLTPPGAELTSLFEKRLETSFTKTDLKYLEKNLSKLLIEDLEIAENVEIGIIPSEASKRATETVSASQTKNDTVNVKITTSTYIRICKETAQTPGGIGCPLCSSIACAIAKASGRPVTIQKTLIDEDGKTIETTYQILETAEPQEQTLEGAEAQLAAARHGRLSKAAGISLIGLGAIVLSFVGWIIYYDTTTHSKSLAQIFLGPRTGEAMSLGIGMRLLYYFLLGLASTLTGTLVLVRRRHSKKKYAIPSGEPAEEQTK